MGMGLVAATIVALNSLTASAKIAPHMRALHGRQFQMSGLSLGKVRHMLVIVHR